MAERPDPTKDPEFQKVVQTLLHTKPQPQKPKKKAAKVKKSAPRQLRNLALLSPAIGQAVSYPWSS